MGSSPRIKRHVLGTGLTRGRAPCGGPQNTQHQATLASCPVTPSPSQTYYPSLWSSSIPIDRDPGHAAAAIASLARGNARCACVGTPHQIQLRSGQTPISRRGFSRCPSTGGLCNLSNRVAINSPSQKQIELSNSPILTAELNTRAEAVRTTGPELTRAQCPHPWPLEAQNPRISKNAKH